MRLTVCTAAFYSTLEPIHWLAESCKRLGVSLVPYGVGQQFPMYVEGKLGGLLKVFPSLSDSDLLMYVDGGDSFLAQGAEEIVRRFLRLDSSLVVSAERECYPVSDLAAQHPPLEGRRYVNGGGFMGYTETVHDAVLHLYTHYRDLPRGGDSDQARLTYAYLEGKLRIMLDNHSSIFSTFPIINSACVYHFNGRTGGIGEKFEEVFGCSA